MAAGSRPLEAVHAFPIEKDVLFKHYFEGDVVFQRLKPFYNGRQYRFEVPVEEFDAVKRFLRSHGYDVSIVHHPEPFYVVVRQYTAHPEGIFKKSVRHTRRSGWNCFLMKGQSAVESAVEEGATRLARSHLSVPSQNLVTVTQ